MKKQTLLSLMIRKCLFLLITLRVQMQYQDGVVKLVSLKTRNAKREIVIAEPLKKYLLELRRIQDVAIVEMSERREQNQTMLMDLSNEKISSLELVNSLADGSCIRESYTDVLFG